MRKATALRLKPDDVILYGYTRDMRLMRRASYGIVRHVTPKGGVLVGRLDDAEEKVTYEEWVPFFHIIEKVKR
jgi:hypothetical protein